MPDISPRISTIGLRSNWEDLTLPARTAELPKAGGVLLEGKRRAVLAFQPVVRGEAVLETDVLVVPEVFHSALYRTGLRNLTCEWRDSPFELAIPLGDLSFVSHNEFANTSYRVDYGRKKLRLIAERDIAKGEELSLDYTGRYRRAASPADPVIYRVPEPELPLVQVIPIAGKGKGLVAAEHLSRGRIVCTSPVRVFSRRELDCISKIPPIYDMVFEWQPHRGLPSALAIGAPSFLNHSYNPNCEHEELHDKGLLRLRTRRSISPGEELTIDYGVPLSFKVIE